MHLLMPATAEFCNAWLEDADDAMKPLSTSRDVWVHRALMYDGMRAHATDATMPRVQVRLHFIRNMAVQLQRNSLSMEPAPPSRPRCSHRAMARVRDVTIRVATLR